MVTRLAIHPLGDAALYVELEAADVPEAGSRALALAAALRARPGVLDAVAGCAAVTVHYDPDQLCGDALGDAIARLDVSRLPDGREGRLHELTVVYDGPHLTQAADALGLPADELVRRHTAALYRVQMTAPARGLYLAPSSGGVHVPRHGAGGTHMPAGSVAVAGCLTAIGSPADPEGWHLVGRTDPGPLRPRGEHPMALRAGDRVRLTAG